MNQYHKLYTPQDSAVVFIDHQPQMLFGVANADRATLINNVTLLAKVAKEFNVPTVLSSVETESFSGYVWPQLLDIFPGQPVIERSSMNSWDSQEFRKAIEATGRKISSSRVSGPRSVSPGPPSRCSVPATTFMSLRIAAEPPLLRRTKRPSRAWSK